MHCVAFNAEATAVACGHTSVGVTVYRLRDNLSEAPRHCVEPMHVVGGVGAVGLIGLLHETPIVALVGSSQVAASGGVGQGTSTTACSTDRLLQLYDAKRSQVMCEVHFDTAILNVVLNVKRVIVILERQTHIFDIQSMEPLYQIRTIQPINRFGIGALSDMTCAMQCYFAYPQSVGDGKSAQCSQYSLPGHRNTNATLQMIGDALGSGANSSRAQGDVIIVDAMTLTQVAAFSCHKEAIAAIAFLPNGTRFATCSVEGTNIKVYSCPYGQQLFQFRRGNRAALVHHLTFSLGGEILAATSDSGTVHLFMCEKRGKRSEEGSLTEARSFAKVHLPVDKNTRTVCAVSTNCRMLSVVMLHPPGKRDGCLLAQYAVDESCRVIGEATI